ncbi:MAG: D-beta-D-heptose 1-phosphate adenylyltransferase [Bacteroidia bacterium]|nr:D-beta-D-heptose 1-phosphate adenylyltransferase [Bacteroidia bacterium]
MRKSKFEIIQSKILSGDPLQKALNTWRFYERKIVFTNGCFDLLHYGHVEYLSKAKDLGDVLIVGLNTDSSVKRLKGNHRPLQDEKSRASILASLLFVDAVVLFDEDTPYNLISHIRPHVLVKGSDYKPEQIVGYDILKTYQGEVKTIDFVPGYSTSAIEEKIRKG